MFCVRAYTRGRCPEKKIHIFILLPFFNHSVKIQQKIIMLYKLHIIVHFPLWKIDLQNIMLHCVHRMHTMYFMCVHIFFFTLNSPAVMMYTCLVPNISWLVYNHMHVRAGFWKVSCIIVSNLYFYTKAFEVFNGGLRTSFIL